MPYNSGCMAFTDVLHNNYYVIWSIHKTELTKLEAEYNYQGL